MKWLRVNMSFCLFNVAGYGQRFSWRKVCSPHSMTTTTLCPPTHVLRQSEACLLLLQITRPIRCTTTSHVITLTIPVTAPARVWWPRISVRSSASASTSVSVLSFLFTCETMLSCTPCFFLSLHKQRHRIRIMLCLVTVKENCHNHIFHWSSQ